jgi:uncharacterized protein with FMN-binding domain
MRRITLWLLSTFAGLVLVFSYRTSTMGAGAAEPTAVAAAPAPTPTPTPTSAPTSKAGGTSGSYAGATAQTRWGPIQVSITVTDGKITDVAVPVYPNGNQRDEEINAYALPALRQSTLDAQSAAIDGVSGATVTSDGYKQSLQAALDAAGLS